jgi:hypothetical protein
MLADSYSELRWTAILKASILFSPVYVVGARPHNSRSALAANSSITAVTEWPLRCASRSSCPLMMASRKSVVRFFSPFHTEMAFAVARFFW